MGLIPQLHCIKCLCLFHHECVGLDRNDVDFHLNLPHDLIGGRGGGDHNTETPPKDYECAVSLIIKKLNKTKIYM